MPRGTTHQDRASLPRTRISNARGYAMSHRAHGLALVALLALFVGSEARIRDEPVERDGRALIPIAMDYGFEEEGTRPGRAGAFVLWLRNKKDLPRSTSLRRA